MHHLDLFSGIGGFSLAADQVFDDVHHTFVEINPFCQAVLKKHWPESTIYGDIKDITEELFFADSDSSKPGGIHKQSREKVSQAGFDIVTGGFPCQPFSIAGKRGGSADDRYLWPEMFRVIQIAKPTWVIAENVPGIISQGQGVVFEQVCLDLENEGYEVQPIIIPACAVNAPHRRNRVWFIACNSSINGKWIQSERDRTKRPQAQDRNESWNQDWTEVATRLCRVDDGISNRVDRLRALGNAIVPQVAIEIMKAIQLTSQQGSGKAG